MMTESQIEKWKETEKALSEHFRKCRLCRFPSKRHLCRERFRLEEENIAAFKGK